MPTALAIETRDLTKVYRGWFGSREVRAVDGVSLQVRRGTTFGFLGPNGAGKTTFVKMLLSCTEPTSGDALLLGARCRERRARMRIGYLPENHNFPRYFTAAGMLDFYGALSGVDSATRKRRIPELLDQVALGDWAATRLTKFSKGMLQRLGLAQAMLGEPELLILDEPTDGVDPVGRIRIREVLHQLSTRGVTVFINSHLLAEVEGVCEEVAILNKGRVALSGKVRELTAGAGYLVAAVGEDGRRLEQRCSDRDAANRAIDQLRAAGLAIEAVAPTAATLEDVFVRTIEERACE